MTGRWAGNPDATEVASSKQGLWRMPVVSVAPAPGEHKPRPNGECIAARGGCTEDAACERHGYDLWRSLGLTRPSPEQAFMTRMARTWGDAFDPRWR